MEIEVKVYCWNGQKIWIFYQIVWRILHILTFSELFRLICY